MAVYFVLPTRENITKICQDCKAQLYDNYYFNFITPISRSLLEDLAKAAVESNCVAQISRVYDQYLNFISLEEDLFVSRHQDTQHLSYYGMCVCGWVGGWGAYLLGCIFCLKKASGLKNDVVVRFKSLNIL